MGRFRPRSSLLNITCPLPKTAGADTEATANTFSQKDRADRGAWANIRTMPNRVKIFPFSAWVDRQRNAVERFFNRLKHFRAIATRYD